MPDQVSRYAVVGNPISQSKSPVIHSLFAREFNHQISYERIEGKLDDFCGTIDSFRAAGGHGLNITAPFKEEAFRYATHCSAGAKAAGAVNCMKFVDGEVHAENFDGVGLVRDVTNNLNVQLKGRRILILGAGGATRGVLVPIAATKPSEIVIANRDLERAETLVQHIHAHTETNIRACHYDTLPSAGFDIIINATSTSLSNSTPPIRAALFAQTVLAYDLSYGKGPTPFLRLANDGGALRVEDGIGMLVEQAAEAFQWWRGVRPQTQPVITALRESLA
jgi:shikimate dehydrogenase